jgi:hypothetical protein
LWFLILAPLLLTASWILERERRTTQAGFALMGTGLVCIGAAILARIPRVVFGAREPRTGACESVLSIPNDPGLEHRPIVTGGVEAGRARDLLQSFFRLRRG